MFVATMSISSRTSSVITSFTTGSRVEPRAQVGAEVFPQRADLFRIELVQDRAQARAHCRLRPCVNTAPQDLVLPARIERGVDAEVAAAGLEVGARVCAQRLVAQHEELLLAEHAAPAAQAGLVVAALARVLRTKVVDEPLVGGLLERHATALQD